MAVSRRTSRSRFTLILLVLTSITVLTLDFRGDGAGLVESIRGVALDVVAPVQSAARWATGPIGDAVGAVTRYGDLEAENEQLRLELEEARANALRAEDAVRENRQLRELVDLTFAGDIPSVTARVIGAPISNYGLTVELDRGSEHGIARDMPVVTGAGLVGRVVQTGRTRSVVLLITDPTSSVGVRLARSGTWGVATGGGRSAPLRVDFVDAEATVRIREAVITSGLQGSVFPPNLPVGRVVDARPSTGALQQDLLVEPVVDFDRLEFVQVLQWRPQS